ncbi:DNA-dependent metalloprotease SPRTN-like [Macrobrachium nipponense]|uniref:DNA-dependent metalloprotease SPRTN-like n=1 Tax=Macrobrachium nipponense TaxID=159736 RepID=UPI0030C87C54
METKNVWSMFKDYDRKYFGNKLSRVKLSWSPRMTLCAGKTAFKVWKRGGTSCSIRLSQPLLSQRPHSDTVNTLLHEMIHAYLHVTQGQNYRDSHGPEFRTLMKQINGQEGSKITIYHNFKKEVDKYRINVYRCDGPCVKKRPFFGILRRAIGRPPGPTDKWWAQHQLECGGTFHKIGGPGSTSPEGKIIEKIEKKQITKYCKKFETSGPSSVSSVITDTVKKKKLISRKTAGNQRKVISKKAACLKGTVDEDAVLKRIRDKYSNVRQTIMLSGEAANQLRESYHERSFNSHPVNDSHDRYHYRYPAPFGNYVEGKINYNYQSHSPKQIKIKKYLERYREARKSLESQVSESLASLQPFPTNKSMLCVQTSNFQKTYQHLVSARHFKYDYKSKTPDKIRLGKYINKYQMMVHSGSNNLESSTGSCKETSRSVKDILVASENSFTKNDLLSFPGTSKTTLCPICSVTVLCEDYDQHLGKCFGDDFDFEDALDFKEKDPSKVSVSLSATRIDKKKTCADYWDNMFAATNCRNCGSRVLLEEMQLHLQYCTDSDESSSENSPEKLTYQNSKDKKELFMNDSLSKGFVSCPSCLERVKEQNINEHLDECLSFVCEEF